MNHYQRILNVRLQNIYLEQIDLAVDNERKVELLKEYDKLTGNVVHPTRYTEMVNYTPERWHFILVQREREDNEADFKADAVQRNYETRERLGLPPIQFSNETRKRIYEREIGDKAARARNMDEHAKTQENLKRPREQPRPPQ